MSEDNLGALVILLRLFRSLSLEPIEDEDEFEREVEIRWKFWRDVEGWKLRAGGLLDGYFELHLREAVLGVRVFKNRGGGEADCIARFRILLNGEGLTNSVIELVDDPDAKFIAAELLRAISQHGQLQPLHWSMARALRQYVRPELLVSV